MMFKYVKPFPIEGFQRINAEIKDGFVEICNPDDGEFYHLKHIIATTYFTEIEAINSIRAIYEFLPSMILPLYGFDDEIVYGQVLHRGFAESLSVINILQFHYADLNNYMREAQLVYFCRKKGFQCPEEVRRSIALIGMAYVELAGGPQVDFIQPTEEDIMWMQHAASELGRKRCYTIIMSE